ncbi:hypothetical protein QVD17_28519 [Tagetes erecta]|uniref:Uncharacterized protein n=1 Tax=Tagetes erecta TaxID=13708 RepID=A0AAD8KB25_TARER|nr:hypothetical protein QVD17_28519 [Tagetes erecta]
MHTRNLEILEAVTASGGVVSQTLGDGGIVRVKILIKRRELEQVIKKRDAVNKENCVIANCNRRLSRSVASKSLKSPVNDTGKVNADGWSSHWRPALQSIQEEF